MSEQGFSLEEILKELRDGSMTAEVQIDPQANYQAQPASQVVQDVMDRTKVDASAQAPTREVEIGPKEVAQGSDPAELKSAIIKEIRPRTEPIDQAEQDRRREKILADKALRDMQYTTTHLRYISLRRTRKKKVDDFVITSNNDVSKPQEFEMEEEQVVPKATIVADTTQEEAMDYTHAEQKSELLSRIRELSQTATRKLIVVGLVFVVSMVLMLAQGSEDITAFAGESGASRYLWIQLGLLFIGSACNFEVIKNGARNLFARTPNINTLYVAGVLSCFVAGAVYAVFPEYLAVESVQLYSPLCLLLLVAVAIGEILSAKRMLLNYPAAVEAKEKHAVCRVTEDKLAQELTKDVIEHPVLVHNSKADFLTGFLAESMSDDLTDQIPKRLFPLISIAVIAAVVLGTVIGGSVYVGLSAMQIVLLLSAGLIPTILCNYPLYDAAHSLSYLEGAVLGYGAVEKFADTNAATLNANELFTGSDVTLYGIKTFSDVAIDRVILDAACVLGQGHSILGEVFLNIIDHRTDFLEEAENVLYEDGMGISAWVGERRLLIGSRELMIHHNISVPNKQYEEKYHAGQRNLVYLATDGSLSAVFVIGMECRDEIINLLTGLYANGVTAIVKTVDPIITGSMLAQIFHLPEDAFRVISSRLHKEFDKLHAPKEQQNGAVCNNGTLTSYLYSFLLAKSLRRSIDHGKLIYFFTMALGVVLALWFTMANGLSQVNNMVLCGYQLVSLGVCYLVQKFTRL